MKNENTALYAFRKFGDTVLRAAFACCGNYAEAEDITQDIFLLLHSRPENFRDDEHMKAWLLKVTVNKCKNFRRSFRFSRTDALDDEKAGSCKMDVTDVEIRELIASLPQKYSAVVFLHFYEGYTIAEIADILGKNANTTASLLRRGKEMLKLELTKNEVTGGIS